MLEETKIKKTRNKPTNYGVDIHIRLRAETFEQIKKMSEKHLTPYSKVIRKIIEDAVAKENN